MLTGTAPIDRLPGSNGETPPAASPRVRRVEQMAWLVSAPIMALHAWLHRFDMVNLDGISYLELGWAWHDGRWADAVNTYWSPLYPVVLAGALALFTPSPYWEYPVVHLANLGAGVFALAGFSYLLRGLAWTSARAVCAAYALFLWSTVVLLVVPMESPDLLLAGWIYLAFGALVRMAGGPTRRRTWATFGIALGCGYLTKSAMLPIAAVFFLALILGSVLGPAEAGHYLRAGRPAEAGHDVRTPRALTRVAMALLAFGLIAGPWIAALSVETGRLTFGESGRLNYIWFVNGSEDWPRSWPVHWPHWSGEAANGAATTAARRLNAEPAVYAFATPGAGTYPMWYEPSRWYEGVRTHVDPIDQLRRIKISLADLYRLFALNPYNHEFFNPQPAMLVAIVLIAAMSRWRGEGTGSPEGEHYELRPRLILWLPPVAAIAMYAAVYLEPRYVGAFIALLWLLALDAFWPPATALAQAAFRFGATAIAVTLACAIAAATWIEAYPAARRLARGEPDGEHLAWSTAARIRAAGIQPGDPIAIAGNAQVATRWAHLLRTPIVAEVPVMDAWKLWDAPTSTRETVAAAFAGAGARWFVLDQPTGTAGNGFLRVEGTPFLVRRLP